MFNKSTFQCAVAVEKFHKSSSERIQILGSHTLTGYVSRWNPRIGAETAIFGFVPTGYQKNVRESKISVHFPVRKFKLPNPQEGALRCPNLTPFVEAKGIILHISQQAGVHILTQALK